MGCDECEETTDTLTVRIETLQELNAVAVMYKALARRLRDRLRELASVGVYRVDIDREPEIAADLAEADRVLGVDK